MSERALAAEAVHMTAAARSDVGKTRKLNEDACAIADLNNGELILHGSGDYAGDVAERPMLLALSDGMGGHEAGEVASQMVVETLGVAFAGALREGEFEHAIETAVRRANADVHAAARQESRRGMGATLTAVFVSGAAAYVVEVGDSRGYLLRAERLRQVTRDQSMVQVLVDNGLLSAEAARNSANKNMILQAMGLAEDVHAAICRLELRPGDRLLLCSDGISNELSDDEIRAALTGRPPSAAADTLIDLANARGGRDNLTVIVADFTGEGFKSDDFDSITRSLSIVQEFDPTFSEPARGRARGGKPGKPPAENLAPPAALLQPAPAPRPPAPGDEDDQGDDTTEFSPFRAHDRRPPSKRSKPRAVSGSTAAPASIAAHVGGDFAASQATPSQPARRASAPVVAAPPLESEPLVASTRWPAGRTWAGATAAVILVAALLWVVLHSKG